MLSAGWIRNGVCEELQIPESCLPCAVPCSQRPSTLQHTYRWVRMSSASVLYPTWKSVLNERSFCHFVSSLPPLSKTWLKSSVFLSSLSTWRNLLLPHLKIAPLPTQRFEKVLGIAPCLPCPSCPVVQVLSTAALCFAPS